MSKIGIIGIQGLPARYGAFEQTASQIVRHSTERSLDVQFFVPCTAKVYSEDFGHHANVIRKPIVRFPGIGVILYCLVGFIWCYIKGCRKFIFFGYTLAPLFFVFQWMNVTILCNVDGFEWRRKKWGNFAKAYFRFCERMAARSQAELIFDSAVIARYFSIVHRRNGHKLFYGSETFDTEKLNLVYSNFVSKSKGSIPQSGDFYVVVMRMEPENSIKLIAEGFSQSNTKRKLILIGPSTKYFEREVLPLISRDARIIYLGPIYDREKLASIRSSAFAYIHGHTVGGTNPTLVEAVYLGRPVIAYGSLFNKEVLSDSGRYFRNADQLTIAIDASEIKAVRPPKVLVEYTWGYVADHYLNLLLDGVGDE